MNRVWGLDLLRAVAVLGVLFSHLSYHTGVTSLQKLFPIGPVLGVEIFFVLSGFLIGQILVKEVNNRTFNFSAAYGFMKRRWYRTLPNYYLFLIVSLLIQTSIPLEELLKFFFFLQNVTERPIAGFYGVTWSLTIEEIFYLLFPITIVALCASGFDKKKQIALAVGIFIIVPFLVRLAFYMNSEFSTPDFRKASLIRLDSIAYGVLFAAIKIGAPKAWVGMQRQGLLLLIPFWYLFLYPNQQVLTRLDWQTYWFPVCSLTIALMLPFFDSVKNYEGVMSRLVSWIATISYSLYLCHIPVIIVSNRYLDVKTVISGHMLEVYYICASFLVAHLVHIAWEKPMTNLRDRR